MPRLTLFRENKTKDYSFFDRIVKEQLNIGGTTAYLHKYLGPANQGPSSDATQPQYAKQSPTNIQDLLFLENRDRAYAPDIIRMQMHYSVQNLDFDLSQFGLFLNNDILFLTTHYNTMIELLGRKIMVGDVIELPHLVDYDPLNRDGIPVALKRFYQVTDGNFASEGFSQTWYPHLWRIKCEHLVNSQEFSQILAEPANKDTYLGQWNNTATYPSGYTVTFGDTNYVAKVDVPANTPPPNAAFWTIDPGSALKDMLSAYSKNLEINNAVLEEAATQVKKSGYDNTNLYVVPEYPEGSNRPNEPAPPVPLALPFGSPGATGVVILMKSAGYKTPSSVLSFASLQSPIADYLRVIMSVSEIPPTLIGTGSGPVSGEKILVVNALTSTNPFSSADSALITASQDPTGSGFAQTVLPNVDYRADSDPRYQYIARVTPKNFGYAAGYMTGDGNAPNGLPTGSGISFPHNPKEGDYFLRIDYLPQVLFRWDGNIWVRISSNVRTETGWNANNKSQLSGFINNQQTTKLTDGTIVPQKQALSSVLRIAPDPLPPK